MFIQLLNDIQSVWADYGSAYVSGVKNTLILAIVSTFVGVVIGFICGVLQTIPQEPNDKAIKKFFLKVIRILVRIYIEVFRGTPMILQAVFIYYGLPYFFGINFNSMWAVAITVVSVNTGAYMGECVRGGIISVDPGQTEGAKAIGMNHFQTMFYVIIPQALRNIMPQIGNEYLNNVKDSSCMFIIGFTDFFSVHKMVSGAIFKYFPSATMEMVGYLTMTLIASFILRAVERKMDGKNSFELVELPSESERKA